jgi:prepilin-type N-terminal cleavage/methylation domain-containing protein
MAKSSLGKSSKIASNLLSGELKSTSSVLSGFTIIELLVVIVVIAILAAISLVSYTGIRERAIAAALQSDLKNASIQLEMDKTNNDTYPATEAEANGGEGLPKSSDTEYQYTAEDGNYYLSATSSSEEGVAYYISSESNTIAEGVWSGHSGGGFVASTWKQIAAGDNHTCAIDSNDKAYCWGDNWAGQLGNDSDVESYTPVAVDTTGELDGLTIKSISTSSGSSHTCVIASDDKVYCWGDNGVGQLGTGAADSDLHSVPTAIDMAGVLNGLTIKSVAVGPTKTCVIASDDNAYCWGENWNGSLGNSSTVDSPSPVAVTRSGALNGLTVKSIANGGDYSCVVASDNNAYCWGYNYYGMLGIGSTTRSLAPVAVSVAGVLSGKTILSVTTGRYFTCVIASDNKAYCWGRNSDGQLGDNSTSQRLTPVAVNTSGVLNGKNISLIKAGESQACVVSSDNLAYCWGINFNGQLGDNKNSGDNSSVPVAVDTTGVLNSKTIKSIATGGGHNCVIASDDKAYCWAVNFAGQLGNNLTNNSYVPVAVVNIGTISDGSGSNYNG